MAGELKLNDVSVATESGGVVTVNNSVLHNAITMADTWYLSADKTAQGVISANLARWGIGGNFSGFGNAMTESSGVFTFPETGYYLVYAKGYLESDGNNRIQHFGFEGQYSSNGGASFSGFNYTYTNTPQEPSGVNEFYYGNVHLNYIFVVTNVTQDKVRFYFNSQNSSGGLSGGSDLRTSFQFIRLRSL